MYIYIQHQYISHCNSILYIPYITYGTPGSPWIWKVWGRRACARGWKIAIGMNLAEAAFFLQSNQRNTIGLSKYSLYNICLLVCIILYHLVSYYSVSISCFGNCFSLFGMFWVDLFLFATVFQVHMGMGHGTLVPCREPQVIAGIYGCSSH